MHGDGTAEITILITGVGSGSTGAQVFKALRRGSRPYHIVVANTCLHRIVAPPDIARVQLPPGDHDEYIEALATSANEHGAHFIVPGSDAELVCVANERSRLTALTAAKPLVNTAETIDICCDKASTAAAVQRAGCSAPVTVDCPDAGTAVEALETGALRVPIVIKPKNGGGGSANVYLAQDATELQLFVGYVLSQGVSVVLQEYVGDPESEFTIGVLHYPDGSLGGSFALRRNLSGLLSTRLRVPNRTHRSELGPWLTISSGFTQGDADDFPEVRAAAEAIASAVGSSGPLNVQGRMVGSQFHVYEVNPRFSGTEAIRAMAGWNAPEALMDWHLGLRPAIGEYRAHPCTFIRDVTEYQVQRQLVKAERKRQPA